MRYPAFFDAVPPVRVRDPLAEFLGAAEDGILEYCYIDAVKLAGHSCPTVAAAYWMTFRALRALYPDSLPERGNIRVEFSKAGTEGTAGVVANVAAMLTGAAGEGGFKGLGGRFDRRGKLFFDVDFAAETRFTRLDTGVAVTASVRMQPVPSSPRLWMLLPECSNGRASPDEAAEFRMLWQERVRTLLIDHAEDDSVFSIRPAA